MDIVAHALFANLAAQLISRKRKEKLRRVVRAESMLGAVAPDLIAFLPVLLASIGSGASLLAYAIKRFGEEWGEVAASSTSALLIDATPHVPAYLGLVYSFTHSGLLWAIMVGIAFLLVRRFPYWLMGWGTHIALDVFTHDAGHFPTKLLFPLSDFHLNGTPWSNPVVFVCTYAALLVCYLAIYRPRTRTT